MIERRNALRDYILAHAQATTEELCALFPGISAVTIRRDLTYLEQSGEITRTHGGATANQHRTGPREPFYNVREGENAALKGKLAELAIAFVEERRSIFIDSGTTTMAFAKRLPDKNLTILTTAPNIALHLAANRPSCSVLLTGGNVDHHSLSCSGFGSTELLRHLNIDIAFMGASGFSEGAGFTAGDHFESELKQLVLGKAERIILLMDSSKIGRNMPYTFAQPEQIAALVTDTGLPERVEALLISKGVHVVKAER